MMRKISSLVRRIGGWGWGVGEGALALLVFFAEDFFEVSADGDDADDHEFFGGEEGDE